MTEREQAVGNEDRSHAGQQAEDIIYACGYPGPNTEMLRSEIIRALLEAKIEGVELAKRELTNYLPPHACGIVRRIVSELRAQMSMAGKVDGVNLISLDEYKTLTPREQGYVVYMQAELPGSELKGLDNPYQKGTIQHTQWDEGAFWATLEAQDSEE